MKPSKGYLELLRGANSRSIVCTLTEVEYQCLVERPCDYCGSTFKVGVDRRDCTKAYAAGNVTPCCAQCNVRKGQLTYAQWKRVIAPARRKLGDGNVWPKESPFDFSGSAERYQRAREGRVLKRLFASMFALAEMHRRMHVRALRRERVPCPVCGEGVADVPPRTCLDCDHVAERGLLCEECRKTRRRQSYAKYAAKSAKSSAPVGPSVEDRKGRFQWRGKWR